MTTLATMIRSLTGWLVAGCIVAFACYHDGERQAQLTQSHAQEQTAQHALDSLHRVLVMRDDSIKAGRKQFVSDSIALLSSRRSSDAAVQHYRDLIARLPHDTATITEPASVLDSVIPAANAAIAAQDTTIHKCEAVVISCAALNVKLMGKIGTLEADTTAHHRREAALHSLIPSRTDRVLTATKWTLIGAGLYAILSHAVLK